MREPAGSIELDPKRFAARLEGRPVALFVLRNDAGMRVALTNFGAKILQIIVPDRNGLPGDVALGYDHLDAVLQGSPSMGAFIGRYAGRIRNASFALDGIEHRLDANDGAHCLHGGKRGSRHQVFAVQAVDRQSITLAHRFEQADDGFPGDLDLLLRYRLGDDNELVIEHEARTRNLPCPASFTSHVFFNLDFPRSRNIDSHRLRVPAGHCLAADAQRVATGEILDVGSSWLDFRIARPLASTVCDHAFLPAYPSERSERLCARLECEASGRFLEVSSTEPVLQVYTAEALGVAHADYGKRGVQHTARKALCLEPQQYPNAPNCPEFPQNLVRLEQPYRARTRYRFGILAP